MATKPVAKIPAMTVQERANAGHYKNKKPYASILKNPKGHDVYMNEEVRIRDQVRKDLAVEHGILGHPKEGKVWLLAWEYGHAYGYGEVANYYGDFAELVKEAR